MTSRGSSSCFTDCVYMYKSESPTAYRFPVSSIIIMHWNTTRKHEKVQVFLAHQFRWYLPIYTGTMNYVIISDHFATMLCQQVQQVNITLPLFCTFCTFVTWRCSTSTYRSNSSWQGDPWKIMRPHANLRWVVMEMYIYVRSKLASAI